jgi:DNA gyrase subunit A
MKPVHRRILFSMYELGVTSNTPHKKSARIVGDTMGKYHPHGDSAIYDALVRMAQPWSMSVPLIDGHGNFGSIDADPPAAMRYTEARLAQISNEILRDIDKNTVDFKPNFDESLQEPKVLPCRFPNLLVNGSEGIAVGMATSIPPHNLTEVINGVIAIIDDEDISIDSLIKIIPAPDFPTGGLIMGRAAIKHAYKTGRGGMVIRAKADIEVDDKSGKQRIIITEIPYQVVKATLIKNIADICIGKDKKIEGITDIHEQSDREGLRIVIDLKRDAQPQVVLNQLYKHTQMQTSVGIIFLALADGAPKFLNLKEMLVEYLEHQKKVIVRRTKYDLDAAEARAHILDGLVIALANIDEVIRIIKTADDKADAQMKLMKKFVLSEKQSNAILDMKLHRLAKLEVEKIKQELAELKVLIADLKSILASPKRVLEIIKKELTEIRDKYGMERRTELVHDFGGEIEIADLIEKEDVVVSMSHYGYIKRLPLAEYRAQRRGGRGANTHQTKEEDFVETLFVTSTHHDLLFFTNVGKVYCIKAYEVPEAAKATKGRAIVNLLQIDNALEAATKERVTAVIPVENFDTGHLMMATADGLVKKTDLNEFKKIRRVGKVAITLREGDELIGVQLTSGRDEILMASSTGKCIRFSEEDVRSMGRTAAGVKSIHLDAEKDKVVDMTVIMPGYEILTVSSNGYGKRSEVDDYRLQSRAGKGIKAGIFNEKTGCLVNLKQVKPEQDVMLISDNGTIIRTRAREISKISRDTQGVRIMKVQGNAKVVCVAIAQADENDDAGGEA